MQVTETGPAGSGWSLLRRPSTTPMNSRTVTCLLSILASRSFADPAAKLPNPDRLLAATAPSAPFGMKETARASRITPVKYTNKFLTKSLKNSRTLDTTAALCLLIWSLASSQYSFPGKVTLMWGVYEDPAAAKLAALARTWGQKAPPPKPSMSMGTFSGVGLGTDCWHSLTAANATIVTHRGRIVVQVVELPPSKLSRGTVVFQKHQEKTLHLMESLAANTLAKTETFLSTQK